MVRKEKGRAYTSPTIDPTLTIIPDLCAAICGMTALAVRIAPKTFASNVLLACSIDISITGPTNPKPIPITIPIQHLQQSDAPIHITPALFTNTSIRLSSLTTCSIAACTLSSLVTSRLSFLTFG